MTQPLPLKVVDKEAPFFIFVGEGPIAQLALLIYEFYPDKTRASGLFC